LEYIQQATSSCWETSQKLNNSCWEPSGGFQQLSSNCSETSQQLNNSCWQLSGGSPTSHQQLLGSCPTSRRQLSGSFPTNERNLLGSLPLPNTSVGSRAESIVFNLCAGMLECSSTMVAGLLGGRLLTNIIVGSCVDSLQLKRCAVHHPSARSRSRLWCQCLFYRNRFEMGGSPTSRPANRRDGGKDVNLSTKQRKVMGERTGLPQVQNAPRAQVFF